MAGKLDSSFVHIIIKAKRFFLKFRSPIFSQQLFYGLFANLCTRFIVNLLYSSILFCAFLSLRRASSSLSLRFAACSFALRRASRSFSLVIRFFSRAFASAAYCRSFHFNKSSIVITISITLIPTISHKIVRIVFSCLSMYN